MFLGEERTAALHTLEERLSYTFQDISLLQQALTHSSYANERTIHKTGDYERLEFLGDAVLELCTSEYLYQTYPDKPEGWLTRRRASLVNEKALASCARKISLEEYILLGRGESRGEGRRKDSIVSDVAEACIGAIYLDGGFEAARAFVRRFALTDIELRALVIDAKTILQELVQGHFQKDISYRLVDQSGPDHLKHFEMEVLLGEEVLGRGEGHSKKDAQQEAAHRAILYLKERYPEVFSGRPEFMHLEV